MTTLTPVKDRTAGYLELRRRSRAFNNQLVKTVHKNTLQSCGRKLGLLKGETLVFGSEIEMDVLLDYCLYDHYSDGENAVQQFRRKATFPKGSIEADFLDAACSARYCLSEIHSIGDAPEVFGFDVLRQEEFSFLDVGFHSSLKGPVVLGVRILKLADFSITSGAALPFFEGAFEHLMRKLVSPDQTTFANLKQLMASPQSAAEMTAKIIRSCLESDSVSYISYQNVESSAHSRADTPSIGRAPAARLTYQPSRNQPCPCGSSRLYKRCCGRK